MTEGYRWYHTVDPDWVKARKHVFTATDLRSLIPAYKRWRKKNDPDAIDPDFSALIAEKLSSTKDIEVSSFSWAARGHIMEPYAIKEYNRINPGSKMLHWDDYIIADSKRLVGFSPDGLDISEHLATQCESGMVPRLIESREMERMNILPERMVEIKSYSPGRHMKSIMSKPSDLDERYQIAVGMLVCPTIQKGSLVFYNPTINNGVAAGGYRQFDYGREDLKEEIDLMSNALSVLRYHLEYINEFLHNECEKTFFTEEDIYGDFVEQERAINAIQ